MTFWYGYCLLFYSVAAVKTITWHLLNSIQVPDGGVADPRCLSRIRIFPSRVQGQKRNGYESATKNLIIFNPIFIPNPDFFPSQIRIPDPGFKQTLDPRILIRNIAGRVAPDYEDASIQFWSWFFLMLLRKKQDLALLELLACTTWDCCSCSCWECVRESHHSTLLPSSCPGGTYSSTSAMLTSKNSSTSAMLTSKLQSTSAMLISTGKYSSASVMVTSK